MRVGLLTAILAITTALGGWAGYSLVYPFSPPAPGAGVRVNVGTLGAHGSGVHIGGGRVITAAHVTIGEAVLSVQLENGSNVAAREVWHDTEFDVSLVQMATVPPLGEASLRCKPNYVGQRITILGHPGHHLDFLRVPASVVGEMRTSPRGESDPLWREFVPVSADAWEGMSGGPAFDTNGRVVGLWNGFLTANPSLGFMVPATRICALLEANS